MSLINKMLRDLDARRAPAADRPSLPLGVRAAQRRPERSWLAVGVGVGVVAVATGGAWYWFAGTSRAPAPQISPALQAAPVPQPGPGVAATSAPAPAQVAPSVAQFQAQAPSQVPVPASAPAAPAPVQAPVSAQAQAPAAVPTPVAPAQARAAQPQPAAPVASAPRPKQAAAAQVPVASASPAKPVAAVASPKPAAAKPAGPTQSVALGGKASATPASGSIDKRPHGSLANEAAETEYNKAIAALRRGANTEAIEGLQSALRLDPSHVSARQALLSLLVRVQRLAEAQAVAAEGLTADPSQAGWATVLARLQAENGKLAEASETLARHARYAEQNADYQAFSAVLMQKQKRFREAVDLYRAALTLRATESRWWYGFGVSLEADQKPQEARAAFLRAKEIGNLPPELAAGVERHLR